MVYDEARQQVLLFGGDISGTSTVGNDTWVWNGSWTKLSPVNAPEARAQMAIAFDQAAQQVVLFAGSGGNFSNTTWFWDGANWTKKIYIIYPTDRSYPAAAYDGARQQLVLFAGNGAGLLSSNTLLNDTWIFSNNLNPPQYPLSITNSAATDQIWLNGISATSGFPYLTIDVGPFNSNAPLFLDPWPGLTRVPFAAKA